MGALLLIPFLFTNYIPFFLAGQGSLFTSMLLVGLCGRKLTNVHPILKIMFRNIIRISASTG